MRVHSRIRWFAFALGSLVVACSGSSKPTGDAAGGRDAVGGDSALGGSEQGIGGSSEQDTSGTSQQLTGGAPQGSGGNSAGGTSAASSSTGGTWNGVIKCANLPAATGPAGVAKPSGAAGNLKVINWAGYTGAVSFTFDDQSSSQMAAYPTLNALGVKYTFYVVSGWGLSNSNLKQAVVDGHEIGNHTSTHDDAVFTSEAVDTCTSQIQQQLNTTAYTFASPYGKTGWEQYTKDRFIIGRGISNGLMKPNDSTNQWNTPCYIPASSAPTDTMNKEILAAQTGSGWKVVLVHGFTTMSDNSWQPVVLSDFTATVEYAKSLGNLWIDTVRNIGSYWVGQKLIAKAAPTTSGADTVYNWTWPGFYPPDSCVRVTVDGGTLTQNGTPVQWDEHGYYEISLNAGSLTISP